YQLYDTFQTIAAPAASRVDPPQAPPAGSLYDIVTEVREGGQHSWERGYYGFADMHPALAAQLDPEQDPWPRSQTGGLTYYPPHERVDVKAMLGIPVECPLWEVRVATPHGAGGPAHPRWYGYDFLLWGTMATADDPPDAPRFLLYQPHDTRKRRGDVFT